MSTKRGATITRDLHPDRHRGNHATGQDRRSQRGIQESIIEIRTMDLIPKEGDLRIVT